MAKREIKGGKTRRKNGNKEKIENFLLGLSVVPATTAAVQEPVQVPRQVPLKAGVPSRPSVLCRERGEKVFEIVGRFNLQWP